MYYELCPSTIHILVSIQPGIRLSHIWIDRTAFVTANLEFATHNHFVPLFCIISFHLEYQFELVMIVIHLVL